MQPIRCSIKATRDGQQCELGEGADQLAGQAKANLMMFVAGVGGKIVYHGLLDVPLEIVYTPLPANKPRPMDD